MKIGLNNNENAFGSEESAIRVVFTDLWGTLVYRDIDYSIMQAMMDATGADIPKEKFNKIYEKSVQTRRWNYEREAYVNLCASLGVKPYGSIINSLLRIREETKDTVKLYPHTIQILKQLRDQGKIIGLITNSSVFAIEDIKRQTDLLNYIDILLPSYVVGVIKPELKIFYKGLELSRCNPKEAVMKGDNFNDDVIPARSIGMHAILVKHSDRGRVNETQLTKDFAELGVMLEL